MEAHREAAIEAAGLRAVAGTQYARPAADYFAWARARGLGLGDAGTVRAWGEYLLASGLAPSSLVPKLSAAKKAIRAAAHELLSSRDATAVSEALRGVKAPRKATNAVGRSFVLSATEELLAASAMSERDAALFEFLMKTGARISEALGIRLAHCEPDGSVVSCLVLGKGGKSRKLRVAADLFAQVRESFNGETWLFETARGNPLRREYAYGRISKAVLEATGKRFSPHCARHTFATRAMARTGKTKAISLYLGHSSVAITLDMYVHEELTDEELAS
ncbi:MAG: site-specific integrase [Spirochaetota bacterium]